MTDTKIRPGDFTGLATDYSSSRPDYSASVLSGLLGLLNKPCDEVDFVDVGAGTGIWTQMVFNRGVGSATAIEPNDDMRAAGIKATSGRNIQWRDGRGEATGATDACCDWLTMASSFHWVNFEAATREFHRVLRPGGRFTALWNPRLIEVNPLLMEIEAHLSDLRPNIQRVSSGRSGITETLSDRLWASPYFEDVVYLEGRHVVKMTPTRYLSAWRSVNDLRVQLGAQNFESFLAYVERRVAEVQVIDATYLTRAWSARRTD